MRKPILSLLFTFLAVTTCASPGLGHDHGAPTFQPPKGGVLKSTHMGHFELVKNQNTVNLYVYNEDGKSLPTKDFKLTANLELPRKKASSIILNDKTTHWETIIDAKGAHRFTLKLLIDDGKEKDNVQFTIENK